MSSKLLNIKNVSRSYSAGNMTVHALCDANLTVSPGELVAVMGPSGSGKSTLLTIAGGLEVPDRGEVLVGETSLTSLSSRERAAHRRRHIGYVFQELNLIPALKAGENVSLPLELDGMNRRAAATVAAEALERLGIGDKAGCFPDQLSGGERQRVAIARATVGDRKLILADEPTGALDSVNGEEVMRLLKQICDSGAGAMLVTHDAALAAWADRIVFLRDGRIVDHTTTSDQLISGVA